MARRWRARYKKNLLLWTCIYRHIDSPARSPCSLTEETMPHIPLAHAHTHACRRTWYEIGRAHV